VARLGTPSVLYDNVGRDRAVDSASLAMVLTSGTLADRVLGESTYAMVPFRSLLLFTGNNTRIVGDLNAGSCASGSPERGEPVATCVRLLPRRAQKHVAPHAGWRSRARAGGAGRRTACATGRLGLPRMGSPRSGTVCWPLHTSTSVSLRRPRGLASLRLRGGSRARPARTTSLVLVAIFGSEAITVKHVVDVVDREPWLSDSTDPRQVARGELEDVLREIDRQRNSHTIGIYLNQQKGGLSMG